MRSSISFLSSAQSSPFIYCSARSLEETYNVRTFFLFSLFGLAIAHILFACINQREYLLPKIFTCYFIFIIYVIRFPICAYSFFLRYLFWPLKHFFSFFNFWQFGFLLYPFYISLLLPSLSSAFNIFDKSIFIFHSARREEKKI